MFHVHDGYRKMLRIPARAFNLVAKFCNNISAGFGISIRRPNEPSHSDPVLISINMNDLAEAGIGTVHKKGENETDAQFAGRATPEDVVGHKENETDAEKIARLGTSKNVARADHKHMMPFGINPRADGDDAADNVQPEEVYAPDEGEDVSETDLSGTSPFAARADHTHPSPSDVKATRIKLYVNPYLDSSDGYTHATKVFMTIQGGIITEWDDQGDVQIYADGGGGAV